MFFCKQVANALAKTNYEDLSAWRKMLLKTHVNLCAWCGPFHKDVMQHQDMARHLCQHEEDLFTSNETLDDASKESMKILLKNYDNDQA